VLHRVPPRRVGLYVTEVSDSIYGLPAGPLPEGWQAMEAITMVKCLVPDGTLAYQWVMRSTGNLHIIEGIGALTGALADLKNDYVMLVNRVVDDEDPE
jgi:hypothetical protein